jgi:hypothetical protein
MNRYSPLGCIVGRADYVIVKKQVNGWLLRQRVAYQDILWKTFIAWWLSAEGLAD